MKTWVKALICIGLSFAFCFITVGFAALSDDLVIEGDASVTPPMGLYITGIIPKGQTRVEHQSVTFETYSTTVNSIIDRASSGSGSVTYEITVRNNTPYEYAYRGMKYQSNLAGYNGNPYISTTNSNSRIGVVTNFLYGEIVPAYSDLKFQVTYTVGTGRNASTDWSTLINYQFGINISSAADAADAVILKFDEILNTQSSYEYLIDKIDDKYDGTDWKSNYIGNVKDSSSADSTTIQTLFGDHLQMYIDGKSTPVTLLIKREDVDGNNNTGDSFTAVSGRYSHTLTGCEMTLYMTTSDLSKRGNAPVYAASFTCNVNADGSLGEWYMIGGIYYGYANVVGYEGAASTGSFDTGTWRSYAETYQVSDNYSYSITANQTIQTLSQARDNKAVTELQRLINEAQTILNDHTYAGSAVTKLQQVFNDAYVCYTTNASGTATVNSNATRALLIPHIKSISNALKPFNGN